VHPSLRWAELEFQTTTNYQYRLVYKDDLLVTNAWTNPVTPPLPNGWTNGTGLPMIIVDPSSTNRPWRFYRLEVR